MSKAGTHRLLDSIFDPKGWEHERAVFSKTPLFQAPADHPAIADIGRVVTWKRLAAEGDYSLNLHIQHLQHDYTGAVCYRVATSARDFGQCAEIESVVPVDGLGPLAGQSTIKESVLKGGVDGFKYEVNWLYTDADGDAYEDDFTEQVEAETPVAAVRKALTRYRPEFADLAVEVNADGAATFPRSDNPAVLHDADEFGFWECVSVRRTDLPQGTKNV